VLRDFINRIGYVRNQVSESTIPRQMESCNGRQNQMESCNGRQSQMDSCNGRQSQMESCNGRQSQMESCNSRQSHIGSSSCVAVDSFAQTDCQCSAAGERIIMSCEGREKSREIVTTSGQNPLRNDDKSLRTVTLFVFGNNDILWRRTRCRLLREDEVHRY
jgi:hypothetical protein